MVIFFDCQYQYSCRKYPTIKKVKRNEGIEARWRGVQSWEKLLCCLQISISYRKELPSGLQSC